MCTCRSVCACMCVFFVDERFISELHKLAPVFEIATRLKSVFDAFSFPSGNPQQKNPTSSRNTLQQLPNCQHSEAIVAHRFSLHVSNLGGGGWFTIENSVEG